MTTKRKRRPSTPRECGNCGGKGLLGHAVWCDEGHAALAAEVRKLRKQLKVLRERHRGDRGW